MDENRKNCECINWARLDCDRSGAISNHHPNCPKYRENFIKIYTVTPARDCASCTEKDIKAVMEWLLEAESGDVLQIAVGEMDENLYDQMPEYMGP